MAVTCVRYEADGWGVAELCTDDRRVLWHELPRPDATAARRGAQAPTPTLGGGSNPPPTAATLAEPTRTGR